MPQYDAGRKVEPPVCDPRAAGTIRAATEAAEPLLEPPGVCSIFQGLRVGEGSAVANYVVTVLPRMTAPAFCSRTVTVASYAGTKLA